MLVLPSERAAERLSLADDRRHLELARVRIGETDDEEDRAVTSVEARIRVEEHESATRPREREAAAPSRPARGDAAPAASAPPPPDSAEIAAAVEERWSEHLVWRATHPRVPATTRDEGARRAVVEALTAAGESVTSEEELPMATHDEQRLCDVCHETPLRRNNRSRMCTRCRNAPKREPRANGHANGVAQEPAPAAEAHGCDPKLLSDEDLAACILEARVRLRGRDRLAELLSAGE